MTARVDILDQPDSLRRPLVASVTVHLAVVALSVAGTWYTSRNAIKWGGPDAMGGAVGITPVSQIPLTQRAAPQNLVANQSKSSVPSQPAEKPKTNTFTKQELDAIALSEKKSAMRELEKLARNQRYKPQNSERPNQLYSSTGAAVSSPLYGGVPGAGGIGIGGVLGDHFGAYASLLQQRIASHWNTSSIDTRIQNARIVTVRFEILRDGSTRNISVFESSGIGALDNSAVRAVTDASPFSPLPAGYSGNSAEIEVYFKLRR